MIPSGIEPATFRLVVQRHRVPPGLLNVTYVHFRLSRFSVVFFLLIPKLHVAMNTSVSPLPPTPRTNKYFQIFPPKSAITRLSELRHNGARKINSITYYKFSPTLHLFRKKKLKALPGFLPAYWVSNRIVYCNTGLGQIGRQMINACMFSCYIKGKVHPCTGTEALYRLYGT